jgi:hypothetical protein
LEKITKEKIMGAQLIELTSRGASMREAYRNAVEEAVYEYGNDSYNGTISTTQGFVDMTKEYLSSGKSLGDFAEWLYENNKISKWGSAAGICTTKPVVNNNKIKTQVATTPQRGNRVWKTIYEVQLFDGDVIGSSEFQIDAINIGRKYTEEHKVKTYVHITKKLTNSSTLVSEISYKKADKETPGSYYFIAMAAN